MNEVIKSHKTVHIKEKRDEIAKLEVYEIKSGYTLDFGLLVDVEKPILQETVGDMFTQIQKNFLGKVENPGCYQPPDIDYIIELHPTDRYNGTEKQLDKICEAVAEISSKKKYKKPIFITVPGKYAHSVFLEIADHFEKMKENALVIEEKIAEYMGLTKALKNE
jgi:hypothetical protein